MPPRWMWPFDRLVSAWFEEVREARKAGVFGGRERDDEVVNAPLTQNEFTAGLRR